MERTFSSLVFQGHGKTENPGRVAVALLRAAVALSFAVLLAAAGCGRAVRVEFDRSGDNPVLVYTTTRAFKAANESGGPNLIIYGDGTTYRCAAPMRYRKGRLSYAEVERLLASIVDGGFFSIESPGEVGLLGAPVDHVTVRMKGRAHRVSADESAAPKPFRETVERLKAFRVRGETDYLPDVVTLHATLLETGAPPDGRVVEWKGDPGLLEQAARTDRIGSHLSGERARQVWSALAEAYGGGDEVYWTAGGRVYGQVFAVPRFPVPEA